jgi:hypothetical protein
VSLVRFDRVSYPEELVTIERRLQKACGTPPRLVLVWGARSSLAARGKPKTIRLDNGPELARRLLDQSVYLNGVESGYQLGPAINISALPRSNLEILTMWHNQRGSAARLQVLRPLDHFASIAAPVRAPQFGDGRCAIKKLQAISVP